MITVPSTAVPSTTVPCRIEIEQTAVSFHAHAIPEGVTLRPGDIVIVHGAPSHVAFGDVFELEASATVLRAGWLRRTLTQIKALFEIAELWHVGFEPKEETP